MTTRLFDSFAKVLFTQARADMSAGGTAIKMMLCNGYTFDPTHTTVNNVVASEVSGTGYTGGFSGSGRKALATKAVTLQTSGSTRWWAFTADNPVWSSVNGFSFDTLILFYQPGGAAADTDNLLCSCHQIDPKTVTGGNLTVVIDPTNGAIAIYT